MEYQTIRLPILSQSIRVILNLTSNRPVREGGRDRDGTDEILQGAPVDQENPAPAASSQVDRYGYGLRVPSSPISPYAKKGDADHTARIARPSCELLAAVLEREKSG